jgi:hypothetical protein
MLIDEGEVLKLKFIQHIVKDEDEEVKETKINEGSSGTQVLPCFDFYSNLESLNISDLQFKKELEYEIRHPYYT